MQDETLTRREEYARYRRTEAWRERPDAALERAGHRCQLCNGTKGLQVHHRTYARIFNEDPGDLTVLCDSCHRRFHGITDDVDARPWRPPRPPRKATAPKPKVTAATSPEGAAILAYIEETGGAHAFAIAEALGLRQAKVNGILGALNKKQVYRQRKKGPWMIKPPKPPKPLKTKRTR